MAFESEKRHARHLLAALEDGQVSPADVRHLYEDADPAFVHLVFTWLRGHYPPSHSASDGVLGRIVALCQDSPVVAKAARQGAQDPIVAWFDEAYDIRALDRDDFVDLVVDKLEG